MARWCWLAARYEAAINKASTIPNKPPHHIADYPVLFELLGPEEFERTVCPLDVARERFAGYREGRAEGYAILEAYVITSLAKS